MKANSMATDKLMRFLKNKPEELENFQFDENAAFINLLEKLREKENISKKVLMIRSKLSKAHIYQIFNRTRIPSRNVIFRLALSMNAELDDVQRLLALAGRSALYPKIRRDAIIIVCILNCLSIDESDEFLKAMGEESFI